MDELRVNNEVKTEGDSIQYIVIKLGAEQYGIDIKYVDNIVRMQHITRVPKVAGYLKGVINLRGEVIPVMNLRLKMGLPEQEATKASRIIILKLEQHGTIGFIVDEVREQKAPGTKCRVHKVLPQTAKQHLYYKDCKYTTDNANPPGRGRRQV